jgi:hypothetical protein
MPWYLRQLMIRGGYMDTANAGDGTGGGGGGGAPEGESGTGASEGGDGSGGNATAGGAAGTDGQGGTKKPTQPSDAEAALLKDMMKHKTRAETAARELEQLRQKFDGIDPERVRVLLAKQAEEERKAAEARGEYDRLVQQMAEQHTADKRAVLEQLSARDNELTSLRNQVAELTVGGSFAQAAGFIERETVLTPAKARVIWGSHFEFKDGRVIAYDKPTGASERTPLVDAQGQPLNFEDALDKLISLDPDADRIRRSKSKPGSGSGTKPGVKQASQQQPNLTGAQRIAAALRNQGKQGT